MPRKKQPAKKPSLEPAILKMEDYGVKGSKEYIRFWKGILAGHNGRLKAKEKEDARECIRAEKERLESYRYALSLLRAAQRGKAK